MAFAMSSSVKNPRASAKGSTRRRRVSNRCSWNCRRRASRTRSLRVRPVSRQRSSSSRSRSASIRMVSAFFIVIHCNTHGTFVGGDRIPRREASAGGLLCPPMAAALAGCNPRRHSTSSAGGTSWSPSQPKTRANGIGAALGRPAGGTRGGRLGAGPARGGGPDRLRRHDVTTPVLSRRPRRDAPLLAVPRAAHHHGACVLVHRTMAG